jgi:phosphatidate cytidylyltransferase
MLKQRIITAIVLLAVLLPALFHSDPSPFCALTLLLIVAGGWEWGRLNGLGFGAALGCGAGLGLALGLAWWQFGLETVLPGLWQASGLFWIVATVLLLRAGVPGWPGIARWLRLAAGLVLIALAWWAMAQARVQGVELLLSILALVWMADIAAYFGGRAFGRRKLAPSISPGKSWAGVYSGAAGVLLLSAVWTWAELRHGTPGASLYGRLWAMGPLPMLAGLLLLTAMSVCGDLIESLVKRSAGVKDSSQLLPGHGGVLDRIDALLPVLPLAMMLATF